MSNQDQPTQAERQELYEFLTQEVGMPAEVAEDITGVHEAEGPLIHVARKHTKKQPA